jgi:hypothetical protein
MAVTRGTQPLRLWKERQLLARAGLLVFAFVPAAARGAEDIVIADFARAAYGKWVAAGEASCQLVHGNGSTRFATPAHAPPSSTAAIPVPPDAVSRVRSPKYSTPPTSGICTICGANSVAGPAGS